MNELFIKQLEALRDHAQKQSEIMEKMIKTVLKEDEEKPIESVTVDGEVYKVGDKFRWVGGNGGHWKHGDVGTIVSIVDGKVFMDIDGKVFMDIDGGWKPWSSSWKRVTEPAKPAWDGKFIPGRPYMGNGGVVVLCTKDGDEFNFSGTVIIAGDYNTMGVHHSIWAKEYFRPVKVKITVEK